MPDITVDWLSRHSIKGRSVRAKLDVSHCQIDNP
jgi:hypothetical protein